MQLSIAGIILERFPICGSSSLDLSLLSRPVRCAAGSAGCDAEILEVSSQRGSKFHSCGFLLHLLRQFERRGRGLLRATRLGGHELPNIIVRIAIWLLKNRA